MPALLATIPSSLNTIIWPYSDTSPNSCTRIENSLEIITDCANVSGKLSTQAVTTVPSGAGSPFSFSVPANRWGNIGPSTAALGPAVVGAGGVAVGS